MTGLTPLLLCLLAAPPPDARVVSGPARLPPGTAIAAATRLTTGPGERLELLTPGGCLLRLGPGTTLGLGPAAPATRCPAVTLTAGTLGVAAPRHAGIALVLRLPRGDLALHHGLGVARVAGTQQGLCLEHGLARAIPASAATPPAAPTPTPPAPTSANPQRAPAAAPTAVTAPTPTAVTAPTPTPTAPPAIAPRPAVARSGQCLWLGAAGVTPSQYAPAAAARERPLRHAPYAFQTPAPRGAVDLAAELARLRDRRPGTEQGGTEVEGGGQSMCLDTGSEGGAGELGTGGTVEIVKPPPPTRLRLRVILGRATP